MEENNIPTTTTQFEQRPHSTKVAIVVGLVIMIPLCFVSFVLGRQSVQKQSDTLVTPTEYQAQPTPQDNSVSPSTQPTQIQSRDASGIPGVTSIYPSSGPIGTRITINGTNFAPTGNSIMFGTDIGSSYPNYDSPDQKTITFVVPEKDNPTCPDTMKQCPIRAPDPIEPGIYEISVSNGIGSSNKLLFTVTGNIKATQCTTHEDCGGGGCNRCQDNRCVNMCTSDP